jgi:hypothetical protein
LQALYINFSTCQVFNTSILQNGKIRGIIDINETNGLQLPGGE